MGWLIDKTSEGLSELGMNRAAGFVGTYGHSIFVDPAYSSYQQAQKIKKKQCVEVAKDFDVTGISHLPDAYKTVKKAVNGDPFAQGQVLGMLPGLYGGWKAFRAMPGKGAQAATTTEAVTTEAQVAANSGTVATGNAEAVGTNSASYRPSWQQSEIDIVTPDFDPQVPFKNGIEVPKNTKGSVRPEGYQPGAAIEVKNYTLTSEKGIKSMISNVVKQVRQRMSNLPANTVQNIVWM